MEQRWIVNAAVASWSRDRTGLYAAGRMSEYHLQCMANQMYGIPMSNDPAPKTPTRWRPCSRERPVQSSLCFAVGYCERDWLAQRTHLEAVREQCTVCVISLWKDGREQQEQGSEDEHSLHQHMLPPMTVSHRGEALDEQDGGDKEASEHEDVAFGYHVAADA
eukprot:scaffold95315_cov37-Tisochrysis_lutea.AAC.2